MWCKGLGTELVGGLCLFCREMGAKYVHADVFLENTASMKVCIKNGFEPYREGVEQKRGTDITYKTITMRKALNA